MLRVAADRDRGGRLLYPLAVRSGVPRAEGACGETRGEDTAEADELLAELDEEIKSRSAVRPTA